MDGWYSFFNPGARCVWMANAMPWPRLPWKMYPILILQEVMWAAGPVWYNYVGCRAGLV